jgi:hypothetical protein
MKKLISEYSALSLRTDLFRISELQNEESLGGRLGLFSKIEAFIGVSELLKRST